MKKHTISIHIIALAALGKGLSGGDRIFIELVRRWCVKIPVYLYVWEEGWLMCQRENLSSKLLKICLVNVGKIAKLGFIFTYFYRVFLGIKLGFTLRVQDGDYIYSASEFWMDSLPAAIIKLRNPKVKWIAAWFQTAPNPLIGFTEGKRDNSYKFNAFLYWFMQLPVKPLINKLADMIFVNNKTEKKQFVQSTRKERVIVVRGAVNTKPILIYLSLHKSPKVKKYLAVFQGRFHPQKGVVELIDIWKLVVQEIPSARLAMIGDGPLMSQVKQRIKTLGLEQNIDLLGYLHDGEIKYGVFLNSTMVVHPAFFDSGGMAAAEAMIFGLPGVGFDLASYQDYYPKGMIRVATGDHQAFSDAILELKNNQARCNKIGQAAKDMIEKEWSWDDKAGKLLDIIVNI